MITQKKYRKNGGGRQITNEGQYAFIERYVKDLPEESLFVGLKDSFSYFQDNRNLQDRVDHSQRDFEILNKNFYLISVPFYKQLRKIIP